ncbi:MAG TPA: hypothetical protein VGI60_01690 [Chthoniobacterales bacterium]|jgi:hypothetical protein
MNARIIGLVAIAMISLPARAEDLQKLGQETTYFYLAPSRANFEHLQSAADQLAGLLEKKDNVALIVAVVIASASEKYHWEITGRGHLSDFAREIADGKSNTARYVNDDARVDVGKLDVWWAEFFATGDTKYPGKILRYAKYPQAGEHAADFMMPAMAAWSFKANCRQHKALMAFAKRCLQSNAYPSKVAFLKECVAQEHVPKPR